MLSAGDTVMSRLWSMEGVTVWVGRQARKQVTVIRSGQCYIDVSVQSTVGAWGNWGRSGGHIRASLEEVTSFGLNL